MATKPVPLQELTIEQNGRLLRITALSERAMIFLERELKPYCKAYRVTPPTVLAYILKRYDPTNVVRYIYKLFEEQ
jgi:hypothetical protein